jgi:hypothetical protein
MNEILEQKSSTFPVYGNVQKLTDVHITTDYHLFGFIKGNRKIDQTNLNNIKESLGKKQILESAIIIGVDNEWRDGHPYKIIEGQHRYTACSDLGLPVSFIVYKDFDLDVMEKSLSIVELLNTASKTWDITNFMYSKCLLGVSQYVLYQQLFEKYNSKEEEVKFEHETLLTIINKYRGDKKYVWFQQFKDGDLLLDEEIYEKSDRDLSLLRDMCPGILESGKRQYVKALIHIMDTPNLDVKRLVRRMTEVGPLPVCKNVERCYEVIVKDVYNKGLSKNKLYGMIGDSEVKFMIN